MALFTRGPQIPLGTYWTWLGRRVLGMSMEEIRCHTHVLGKTGFGKSYFLASLFLALYKAGETVTLIDPHGDLTELLLGQLQAQGYLNTPEQRERLIYLDLPRADREGRFLPFNYLKAPYTDHQIAEHTAEAMKRAWPELAHGAPTFENILKHSVLVLRQNNLPLIGLTDLLIDRTFRQRCLKMVDDAQVRRFFQHRFDEWGKEAALMRESTLNRANLLTFSPFLRFGLGARDNKLPFREILDSGKSVIINLALPSPDTRRLLGCLLTVGLETAALARSDRSDQAGRRPHHLLIDEFSQFMAQSEQSLTRMLSETRKYNLFCVMAHQNWSQASDRLKGALQNVGLEVILKVGRLDAEYSARIFASVDPMMVKHTVRDENASERTHPAYLSLPEQWEKHVQALQNLKIPHAFIRLPDDSVRRVRTPSLPRLKPDQVALEAIKEEYLRTWFRPYDSWQPSPRPPETFLSRRSASKPGLR